MTNLDTLNASVSDSVASRRSASKAEASVTDRIANLQLELDQFKADADSRSKRLSILVFSGSFDRLLAAFTIATGASAMGIEVTMFFAFWGISAVRAGRHFHDKTLIERMMAAMLPSRPQETNPSRWSFGGIGRLLFRRLMRRHNLAQIEELILHARELGVRFICCGTSSELMGIRKDELMPGVECGGVATYLEAAYGGRVALFI